MRLQNKPNGFTFVELMAVTAMIAIIMTLVLVQFARPKVYERDLKRVNDAKQIQTALELYYNRNNSYPTLITPGQPFVSNSTTYMKSVPTNPTPKTDGACTDSDYTYAAQDNNISYTLDFCLGGKVGNVQAGYNQVTPRGIASIAPPFTCGDIVSYEGESYPTVQIGTQCWFAKNLNVGTQLCAGQGAGPCTTMPSNNSAIEKWCYDNSASNCTSYGAFYSWAEMMNLPTTCLTAYCLDLISTPQQGICPTGWHIPTDDEQNILEQHEMNQGGTCNASRNSAWDCADAGFKLKEAGTTHWNEERCGSSTCNSSGFSAVGAGYRYSVDGAFYYLNSLAQFWTATQPSMIGAWYRYIYKTAGGTYRAYPNKADGHSVRCLKDS